MARYPFPVRRFFGLALDLPAGHRSLVADCRAMMERMQPPPVITGTEHIPVEGAAVVVANHYQRRGLWIAWPGACITVSVAERRGTDSPVHWLVTGGLRLYQWKGRGPEIPLTARLLRAVAKAYGMTALPLDGASERGSSVRVWLSNLKRGEVIGLFPEGERGTAGGLVDPEEGLEGICRVMTAWRVPIIPAGIFEDGDRLHVAFGAPLSLAPVDASETVMHAIARQLPEGLRGPYRTAPVTAGEG